MIQAAPLHEVDNQALVLPAHHLMYNARYIKLYVYICICLYNTNHNEHTNHKHDNTNNTNNTTNNNDNNNSHTNNDSNHNDNDCASRAPPQRRLLRRCTLRNPR